MHLGACATYLGEIFEEGELAGVHDYYTIPGSICLRRKLTRA